MELKELSEKTLQIFQAENIFDLGQKLMESLNNEEKMEAFAELVGGDLSTDWLQKIYQYYLADRKDKKQDYTPKTVAMLMAALAGGSETTIDLCAGSGALTIQRWSQNHEQNFILYEVDEKVIPFLLFNLAVRNISATVYHADVLQDEVYHSYKVRKSEKYGNVSDLEPAV